MDKYINKGETEIDFNTRFGKRIRLYRKNKDIKSKKLFEKLYDEKGSMASKIENGTRRITPYGIGNICDKLNITAEELFSNTPHTPIAQSISHNYHKSSYYAKNSLAIAYHNYVNGLIGAEEFNKIFKSRFRGNNQNINNIFKEAEFSNDNYEFKSEDGKPLITENDLRKNVEIKIQEAYNSIGPTKFFDCAYFFFTEIIHKPTKENMLKLRALLREDYDTSIYIDKAIEELYQNNNKPQNRI